MVKKYKRVFSINNDLGYRNYTVRDLIDLKGKEKTYSNSCHQC